MKVYPARLETMAPADFKNLPQPQVGRNPTAVPVAAGMNLPASAPNFVNLAPQSGNQAPHPASVIDAPLSPEAQWHPGEA